MADALTLPAPAKLNLFLHITGRRNDGYHELQTYFQILDACDWLSFRHRRDGAITLTGMTESSEDNLIVRAARRLQSEAPSPPPGVDVTIDKRLPMGGGLGGGSSDAATTLIALNRLWGLGLDQQRLASIGLELGADIPVFIHGRSAWGEGVGEQLTPIPAPEHWFVILHPDCSISTREVFTHPHLTRDTPKRRIPHAFEGKGTHLRNDCESAVRMLYPKVAEAIDWLKNYGNAQLTGTGACVFCSFETQSAAIEAFAKRPSGIKGFIAQGKNQSPLFTQLGGLD